MADNAAGIQSQFGFVAESTAGTFATPTKFAEFTSESMKLEIERIESKGIRAGRRTLHRWAPGVQRVTGDVEMELTPHGVGTLWKHLLGGNVTTGAGPYTHTLTLGQTDDKTLTLQFNRPGIDATDRVFSYLGCSITDLSLSAAINEYVSSTWSFYGMDEDTAQSLASASYPATYTPFVFTHATLDLAGAGYDVTGFDFSIARNLKTDRHFIRSTNPSFPKVALENGLVDITGSFQSDFIDLTAYNRFVNGTEAALVLTFDAGAGGDTLTITLNVRFDGDTPVINGPEIPELNVPFKAVHATADNSAITAVLVNNESSI